MAKKISRTKSKGKHIRKTRRRICVKCNRLLEEEDRQCPFCGVKVVTHALNTRDEWRRLPKRFPREAEKSRGLPLKPEGVPMPGEYKTPSAKIRELLDDDEPFTICKKCNHLLAHHTKHNGCTYYVEEFGAECGCL